MNDYIPFMDLHPELQLIPTSSVNVGLRNFQSKFDYVQDLKRKNRSGAQEQLHLLVKNGKYGVLLHSSSWFNDITEVVLPAIYDSIDFLYKSKRSFGAIIQKDGKYGLFFWQYGLVINKKHEVSTEFDSMEVLGNKRVKGVKNNIVTYFDETGHVLK